MDAQPDIKGAFCENNAKKEMFTPGFLVYGFKQELYI